MGMWVIRSELDILSLLCPVLPLAAKARDRNAVAFPHHSISYDNRYIASSLKLGFLHFSHSYLGHCFNISTLQDRY